MRFLLSDEQREFARALDGMLGASGTPAVARAWATGEHRPGRALWARIAEAGVFGLAVSARHGGMGQLPAELAVAFHELGRHAVPGPLVETVAAAAFLERLGADAVAGEWLPRIVAGEAVVGLCADGPYALDADAADAVLVVEGDTVRRADGHGPLQASLDPARRLFRPVGGAVLARGPAVAAAAAHALDLARLATAAQSLGLGRALLAATVSYVTQRTQFQVPIGSFQAVKHRLADALIGLEFAQPLVHGAALALAAGAPSAGREVAAAKVAAGEAGYAAARTALQLHGALGYTEELDLSLWIRKARPLRDAWGTPADCRRRVLAA
ncbi:alkylation response protein AidB-like acyl-CoA dehydrogenase [Streptomyces sp. 2333.5]|uniref:acyl-CoA dehydrogenase family protein n=1 Tax=unclassified Streptomyces TaxID=2593676 RepID=UPI00089B1CE7|nr:MULTISPECIES: acyl-CoA dehydrogenase family protein [unclassified Streptomyces]PJJ00265.1 alkylation response protein AidB-like acyl-CoA dehydrogenase [Streptomyces sp. 2333.5]SEC71398.1 Acyl-CoA dehydrogenase [Streptomyces sp. 2112.2]